MIRSKSLFCCILLLIPLGFGFNAGAQDIPVKLSAATVIGTVESVDYSDNSISTTVNTRDNAFDGDINSFFAAHQRSGGWVGLDLGEKHVITRIAYCSRKDWPQRLLLAVFEGANQPDFGDAIPLHMIAETPRNNTMTEQTVNCSRGFRYVRYIGPNDVRCNIAELEFYGYPGNGDDSRLYQAAGLPDVVIHTANAKDIISKEIYLKGIVSIISENGTKIYSDSLDIRGRGNASWNFSKKPYRMKLYSKTNVLNLPAKERNWTLINNWGDKTLMRNLLAFDLSERLEMPYTPAGVPVNVFLNGEYRGCYQLCDHIEEASHRVDVEKLNVDDTALPKLSGGYLVEIDAYAYNEPAGSWFMSSYGIPVTVKYPKDDEIAPSQRTYIKEYFDQMERSLYSSNYRDAVIGYRRYMDMETFIRHFLVGEMSGNTDTYWSVFMYKRRNDDRFYFGPVWDFDLAYNNDSRTYPVNSNPNWIYATTGSSAGNTRAMVNRLFTDPWFVSRLKSIYAQYRDRGVITEETLLQVVDDYANRLDASQKLNFTRWNILNSKEHQNPATYGSYAGEVENVRNYIRGRLQWMDRKLGYPPENPEKPETPTATDDLYFTDVSVRAYAGKIDIEGIVSPTRVEILNVSGNKLYSKMIYGNTGIPFRKGIYMVRLSDAKGNIKVVKCAL
ncbi:MAG: CotH kinase family protein [Bacteroidales bacterium]|nr:CotH kinase family protein [Bacteroidales bacterium]